MLVDMFCVVCCTDCKNNRSTFFRSVEVYTCDFALHSLNTFVIRDGIDLASICRLFRLGTSEPSATIDKLTYSIPTVAMIYQTLEVDAEH
jgi:hypothetical protein